MMVIAEMFSLECHADNYIGIIYLSKSGVYCSKLQTILLYFQWQDMMLENAMILHYKMMLSQKKCYDGSFKCQDIEL